MFKRLIAGALVFGMAAAAPPAGAVTVCAERQLITGQLAEDFGEHPVAMGLSGPEKLIEIWSTDSGETWTILLTTPKGASCILGSGTDWLPVTPIEPVDDTAS